MRTLLRFRFVGLAVVAAGLVVATVLVMTSGDERGVAGRLGPTPGPSSEEHISAKRAYLDRIARENPSGEAAALVSLDSLASSAVVETLLRQASAKSVAVFVQFPGNQGESLAVETTVAQAVSTKATQLADTYRAEIETTSDTQEKQDLEAALAAIGPECACVFAFALEGATLRELAQLQKDERVRLVEVPDPLVRTLEGWELIPFFPGGTPTPAPSP